MRHADYEPAWQAIMDGGWGDRRQSLRFYLRFAHAHLFVAEASDGTIVGTASAVQHVETGRIGLVFVAPARRGQGLGRRLPEVALRHLQELACRSVLLAASALGLPIYERLGFAPSCGYTLRVGEAERLDVPDQPDVRPLHLGDLDAVCRLDQRAGGEQRRAVIEALAGRAGQGWVTGRPSDVRGYALRTPWGLGPAIATRPADGPRLLDVLLRHPHPSLPLSPAVPADNHPARAHLAARGSSDIRCNALEWLPGEAASPVHWSAVRASGRSQAGRGALWEAPA